MNRVSAYVRAEYLFNCEDCTETTNLSGNQYSSKLIEEGEHNTVLMEMLLTVT